jgi:hypothetical protein
MPHDLNIPSPGLLADCAKAQFTVDHVVDVLALLFVGHDDLQAMFVDQSTAVEVVLHRELRAQQTDFVETLSPDSVGRGVGDVQQRYLQVLLDIVGRLVHGVGAKDDEIRAAIMNVPSGFDHLSRCLCPLALMLEWFDFSEIDGVHDALGGM